MDPTVPRGAAILLDFIRATEVGRSDAESYNVIFANKQYKLAKPLTQMTLAEVQSQQRQWSRNHGSSAAGGYQFMRATLGGLIKELDLNPAMKLSASLQDRLAYHLLKRRGYSEFMSGRMTTEEFGKRLAMEWASFPVLSATQGAHARLSRGQSYYAGDPLNKALVKPEEVEAVLSDVWAARKEEPPVVAPTPEPTPKPTASKAGLAAVIVAVASAVAAFWDKITGLF